MIYEIFRELGLNLGSRGYPFPLEYGPEAKEKRPPFDTRIVLDHDRKAGDQISGPRSQVTISTPAGKSRKLLDRAVGCDVRIYAKSSIAGARLPEHERLAEQLADAVLAGLRTVIQARATMWRVASAGFVEKEALGVPELEKWPGVVYEIKFSVDRGVFDLSWTGEGVPTGSITEVTNSTRINGETACGA